LLKVALNTKNQIKSSNVWWRWGQTLNWKQLSQTQTPQAYDTKQILKIPKFMDLL
jgi:2-C-methyl-D-erythritol 4-phosphate cytidylyltransferase